MVPEQAPAAPRTTGGAATVPGPVTDLRADGAHDTAGARVPVLRLTDIHKRFGGVVALGGVSLDVLPGEVHALLGENGAGKSTLMGVASGTLRPDEGTIVVGGQDVEHLTPVTAGQLGIAIVHQHPAVLPDLTVAENLRVALGRARLREEGAEPRRTMRALLDDVGCEAHLDDRVGNLTVAQKHLLELAKALAQRPRVLILDEPTAPLGSDSVDLLFDRVRAAAATGTAVVYITHRLAEVRLLADRVTVLRDGRLRGTAATVDVSDDELLALIVGRTLESTFPPKRPDAADAPLVLEVDGLTGEGFTDVSLQVRRGQVLGIAGVVGNGQSELLRALAGLAASHGAVRLGDEARHGRQLLRDASYLPADRHREGLMMSMSVRENAAVAALRRFTRGPFLSRRRELDAVSGEMRALAVKAPHPDTPVTSLSGGNQQKVVLARALLAEPRLVLADEPTQGVDVGARAEIYSILRRVADQGVPVVVASSDAKELEGLCDVVVVMSRGHVVERLEGEELTEERMVRAAVESTTHRRTTDVERPATATRTAGIRRALEGDYAPVVALAVVILGLGAFILSQNDRYLLPFNVTSVLMLVTALGFISLGQTVALLTGGIDLSVGPLAGFLVVVASFFVNDGAALPVLLAGFLLMLVAAGATGAVNGSLVRFAHFTPVAATLVAYIALQGLSFTLRASPGGIISRQVTDALLTTVGPIPVVFVVLVAVTLVLERLLRASGWGLRLRAVGSHEEAARRLGVKVNPTVVAAYVLVSVLVFCGAVLLLAQLGIGDPAQGVGYTLTSITAVVLGGTSLLGGRGTFVGTLLGAFLVVQLLNATTFLGLDQEWQYLFQGALIVVAAVVYSRLRGTRAAGV
ncbi:ATP-binding cassette domain-containing protein [Aquipuribacter nitratireducens]|uniref:Autoinducer 2 import ATP-binding protein LsrA n=1 Tax=Aquipuribacter nitratireducens TaxID=650104 RepID=A0ABW0GP97_9MICO